MLDAYDARRDMSVACRIMQRRRGAILVLAAFLMVFMIMLLAVSVDIGYMVSVQTEMDRATDAAALAGAGALIDGADAAKLETFEFFAMNPVGKKSLIAHDPDWREHLAQLYDQNKEDVSIQTGIWNPEAPKPQPGEEDTRFAQTEVLPSAIRIVASHNNAPLFFAKAFGHDHFSVMSEAVARYQPRDIALVLDFSGSMNDDSELKRITSQGLNREVVESNLLQIYQDLDSPSYGSLQFPPQYLTIVGAPPATPNLPQITVTFRADDVYVVSTKDLSNVVMEFSDGSRQKIEGLSSTSGYFRGSGYNYNKTITKIWVKSGPNDSGEGSGYGERFVDNYDTIKAAFGLTTVAYPYPSGSWNDYINYVKTSSSVKTPGYKKMYGFMTLINYWLENKAAYNQTPDLWKVSAQPVTAVKDASDVFMDYIQEVDTDDRAALVIYNSPSQTAKVEHNLTDDFPAIQETIQHRQAGHYDSYTNIGAGILAGKNELVSNGRIGAFKMIVLMTDGIANKPSGVDPRQYALQQADLAAELHYPIVTISLGSGADTDLMQQIADRTGGVHFNIPSTSTVTDYRDDLMAVFRRIANDRPLILVK